MIDIETHPLTPFLPWQCKTADAGKLSTASESVEDELLLSKLSERYVENFWPDFFQ